MSLTPRTNGNARATGPVIVDGTPVRTQVQLARAPLPSVEGPLHEIPFAGAGNVPTDLIVTSVERPGLLLPEQASELRPSLLK